ncbi:MAG: hypothetical protein J7D61_07765 [Marichromatium sp.]|nr:hypothetical protein [Marichromatium sp.]
MPDQNQMPYEAHRQALEKARAAGDDRAAAIIRDRMKQYPEHHARAYEKAAAAGDFAAEQAIAREYRERMPNYGLDTISADPVWAHNARRLYKAREGADFDGTDEEAVKYGLDAVRDLEFATTSQVQQIYRGQTGDLSDEEKQATLQLYDAFDALPVTMRGVGAAAARVLNPLQSPDTYLGLGFGSVLRRGGTAAAKKAAMEAMRKELLQKAQSGVGKEMAGRAAQDLAERGVRTTAQRIKQGAITAAPSGAAYGAMADATRQAVEEGPYDVGRGATAAGTGALFGAGLGGAVGGVVGRHKALRQQAGDLVSGVDAAPAPAAERLMRSAVEQFDEDGSHLARASDGDVAGAYRALMETDREIEPEAVLDIFARAAEAPESEFRDILDETKAMLKQFKLPKTLARDAQTALKHARGSGTVPDTLGARLDSTLPEIQAMPRAARERLYDNINRMQEALETIGGVSQVRREVLGEVGMAEELLRRPEVNVAADVLPGGYVGTRAAGRLLTALRKQRVGQRFKDVLGRASGLHEGQAVGPRSRELLTGELADRASGAELRQYAAASARNAATGAWADASVAGKDAPNGSRAAIARARALQAAGRRAEHESTRHNGIQGELGVRYGVAKPDGLKALDEIIGETQSRWQDVKRQIQDAVDDGDDATVSALRREEDDLRRQLAEERRFRRMYEANGDTRGYLAANPDADEARYYAIQEAIGKRARPMSPQALHGYLKRVVQQEGGKLAKLAQARMKDPEFRSKLKIARAQEKAARAEAASARPDNPTSEGKAAQQALEQERAASRRALDGHAAMLQRIQARQALRERPAEAHSPAGGPGTALGAAASPTPGPGTAMVPGGAQEGEWLPRPRGVSGPQPARLERPVLEGQINRGGLPQPARGLPGPARGLPGPSQGQSSPTGPRGPSAPPRGLPGPRARVPADTRTDDLVRQAGRLATRHKFGPFQDTLVPGNPYPRLRREAQQAWERNLISDPVAIKAQQKARRKNPTLLFQPVRASTLPGATASARAMVAEGPVPYVKNEEGKAAVRFWHGTASKYHRASYAGMDVDQVNALNGHIYSMQQEADALGLPRLRSVWADSKRTAVAHMGDGVLGVHRERLRNRGNVVFDRDIQEHLEEVRRFRRTSVDDVMRKCGVGREEATALLAEMRATLSRSVQRLRQKQQQQSKGHPWTPGSDGPRPGYSAAFLPRARYIETVLWHEFGHHIHQQWGVRTLQDYYKPPLEQWLETQFARPDAIKPTRYSETNPQEWFAESYTLFKMGRSDLIDPALRSKIEEIYQGAN